MLDLELFWIADQMIACRLFLIGPQTSENGPSLLISNSINIGIVIIIPIIITTTNPIIITFFCIMEFFSNQLKGR